MMHRSAEEVLQDHLRRRGAGELDEDLRRNYADDVAIVTAEGVARGHDAVRRVAARLYDASPDARFDYRVHVADDRMGMLEWTGGGDSMRIFDGVDSYLIEGGKIRAQTIHYRVEALELGLHAEGGRG